MSLWFHDTTHCIVKTRAVPLNQTIQVCLSCCCTGELKHRYYAVLPWQPLHRYSELGERLAHGVESILCKIPRGEGVKSLCSPSCRRASRWQLASTFRSEARSRYRRGNRPQVWWSRDWRPWRTGSPPTVQCQIRRRKTGSGPREERAGRFSVSPVDERKSS